MRRSLIVFVALLGGASATYSQDPPASVVEERITVTATAREEATAEVPTTVDVLDGDRIAASRAEQAIDLLRTLPGLDLAQSGSRGKATSLFTRGTNSSHTLVLWNGVELNDPYLGGFDWSTLALDGVERIEVVRGPYSALYGSSALGGVVQLVTRRATEPSAVARAEAGANDFVRAGASAGFARGPLAVTVAGHLRRGDGEVANDFFDAAELDLASDLALGASFRLGLLARSLGSEIGVPFDFAGQASPEREQELDALSLALPFEWTGRTLTLDGLVGRTTTDLDFRDPNDPFAASRAEAERGQARLAGRFDLATGLVATVGGDFERQEVSSGGAFGPGLVRERQEEWAAFGQLTWSAGPARVDFGLRRDDNDAFGSETSARVAAAWQITPALRLRGGFGEAFRAPSLADLYYPGFSNPALEPERSQSWELALDVEAKALAGSIALFENDLDNLIEFDFTTYLPQNLGRARARGVEASIVARRGVVDARLAATWLDGENLDTGARLLRRAEEKASLALFARPGEWTLGATARYVGDRVDFGDLPLAAHTVLDLTVAHRFGGRYEPFLRIENALDEEYEELAGFPAPGASVAVGIDLKF